MYMICNRCESKHFIVDIIKQVNGSDDTYDFICAGCGDTVNLPDFDDYQTYLVKEIINFKIGSSSIALEEWVEEGARIYYVSLYKDNMLFGYKDFSTVEEAHKCYNKCVDIFESCGSFDTIITLFDEY